ncbi:hypothetical protein [uncultured Kushneria sp.]|uniref:hypothetical protein n=1 Tax=uncultured Kushneria sp. TaxID=905033 RepID=UPI00260931E2|nr:hypothetical protein [uncultured Kushneria sp.]
MFQWVGTSWEWLVANAAVFSGVGTVSMALIWAVYLQLILHNFRQAKKPELIINRFKGHDFNAHCLLSNMSTGTAFIESVIVRLRRGEHLYYGEVTDLGSNLSGADKDVIEQENLRYVTRQGPINQGECLDAGRFGLLIQRVADLNELALDDTLQPCDGEPFTQIEVLTVNIYGRQRHPVGACRSFRITRDQQGGYFLSPERPMTKQLLSRRERQNIEQWKASLGNPDNAV